MRAASARRPCSRARPRRSPARGWPRRCPARRPGARRRRAWRTARCRAPPGAGRAGTRRRRRSARPPRAAGDRSRTAGCRRRRRSGTRCAAARAAPRPRRGAAGRSPSRARRARGRRPSPSNGEHAGRGGEAVGEPQRHRHLGADRRGGVRHGAASPSGSLGSVRCEPWRQRVAQQHHVSDLAYLGQRARGGPGCHGKPAVARRTAGRASRRRRTARSRGAARRRGRRSGTGCGSARRPRPSAGGRPGRRGPRLIHAQVDRLAAVDHGRDVAEPPPRPCHRAARAVDQLLVVAGAEEAAAGSSWRCPVTVTFDGRRRQPAGTRSLAARPARTTSRGLSLRTVAAPTRIASQPARTSSTRSRSASLESTSRWSVGVVEVAVDRDAAAEQDVREVSHGSPPAPAASAAPAAPGGCAAPVHRASRHQQDGARQRRDQHHHAVHHRGSRPAPHRARPQRTPTPPPPRADPSPRR